MLETLAQVALLIVIAAGAALGVCFWAAARADRKRDRGDNPDRNS